MPRFVVAVCVMLALIACAPGQTSIPASGPPTTAADEDIYGQFNIFCLENFGVVHEPLTTKLHGDKFRIIDGGDWQHVSENSACIAWETSLPAHTHVEYGATADYGRKTTQPERPFYIHVHYLQGLKPDTTYHYRLVSVDEKGARVVGEDKTFTTQAPPNTVHLPGDMGKPPYVLTKPGTYVLTEDINSPSTCIDVNGKDITIDLNGHTLTYDNEKGVRDASLEAAGSAYGYFAKLGEHGIRGGYAGRGTARVVNGFIRQGKGAGAAGYQPIFLEGGSDLAGVTVDYYGTEVSGIQAGVKEIHHCVVLDRGTQIVNRHQGLDAIASACPKLHHNLVKRCRQRGFFAASNCEIFANEIYVDSWATNSYDIMCYKTKAGDVHHNRCFGTGYHTIGIGTVSQAEDVKVHENFIHHAAAGANQRWPEYGEMAGVNAIRITWGGKNLTYENNVMVVTGTGQSSIRGLWVCPEPTITGVTFRNNTIAAYARSKDVTSRGAICVCGDGKEDDAPILYEGNTVISNLCNVVLGDSYGLGSNSRFVRNTFVREGRREDYRTIQCGYWTPPTLGHQFIDSTFEAGAAFDKPVFAGEGKRDFSVGWTVTIKTSPLAKVSVTDAAGKEAFSGPAGKTGLVDIQLLQYTQTPDKKIDLTPHKIAVELDGKTATKSVTADKKQQVEIDLK